MYTQSTNFNKTYTLLRTLLIKNTVHSNSVLHKIYNLQYIRVYVRRYIIILNLFIIIIVCSHFFHIRIRRTERYVTHADGWALIQPYPLTYNTPRSKAAACSQRHWPQHGLVFTVPGDNTLFPLLPCQLVLVDYPAGDSNKGFKFTLQKCTYMYTFTHTL